MSRYAQGLNRQRAHQPQLTHRRDGRYEVRCSQCEEPLNGDRYVGIGMPIANVYEAEHMVKNHCRDVGTSRRPDRGRLSYRP